MRRLPRLLMNTAPRALKPVTAPPASPPRPKPSFRSLVSSDIVAALQSIDVHEPNALQARGLPRLLRGEDTLCCAQTGSGKTLLFLLPILRHLLGPPPPRKPQALRDLKPKKGRIEKTVLPSAPDALVLVHSRELALQIAHVARTLVAALPGRLDEVRAVLTPRRAVLAPRRAVLTPSRAPGCCPDPSRVRAPARRYDVPTRMYLATLVPPTPTALRGASTVSRPHSALSRQHERSSA